MQETGIVVEIYKGHLIVFFRDDNTLGNYTKEEVHELLADIVTKKLHEFILDNYELQIDEQKNQVDEALMVEEHEYKARRSSKTKITNMTDDYFLVKS